MQRHMFSQLQMQQIIITIGALDSLDPLLTPTDQLHD